MQKSIRKKFVLVSFTSFFILFTNFERVLASNNRSNQSSSNSTRNNSSSGGADGNGGGSSWDYYHGDSVASNKGALNPYKILGVARDATQEDIKRVGIDRVVGFSWSTCVIMYMVYSSVQVVMTTNIVKNTE